MIIEKTVISDLYVITPRSFEDERGYFMETFRRDLLQREIGIDFQVAQTNDAYNQKKGIIRGLHFQRDKAAETKIIRCVRGRIYDVVVDTRPHSPTFLKWQAVELSEENRKMFLIPRGCAHGYQTLTNESLVQYLTDNFYNASASAGYRYDDPAFGIRWPIERPLLSQKDKNWPPFTPNNA